jgi:hypothetical protein
VVVVVGVAAVMPKLVDVTSSSSLANLQGSQIANATDDSNLKLEQVDFSSRGAVLRNLPRRVRDVVLRPYPWQVANTSQQLGLLGTIGVLLCLWFLWGAIRRSRGSITERAGPLLYLAGLLLIAYSLSSGNAGTSFRYRTHVVALTLGVIAALRVTSPAPVVSGRRARLRGRPSVGPRAATSP